MRLIEAHKSSLKLIEAHSIFCPSFLRRSLFSPTGKQRAENFLKLKLSEALCLSKKKLLPTKERPGRQSVGKVKFLGRLTEAH